MGVFVVQKAKTSCQCDRIKRERWLSFCDNDNDDDGGNTDHRKKKEKRNATK